MAKKTKKAKPEVVWKGLEELRPLLRPIGELKLDPRNDRKHSDRNIMVVKNSLREFGQDQLIVVTDDGTIQKGNARVMAARELGWSHMAVGDSHDEGIRARLRAIVDNRSGDPDVGSEWEFSNLADDLADLDSGVFDLEDFGFTDDELEDIATWESKDGPGSGGEGGGESEAGPRVVVFCDTKEDRDMIFDKMTEEGFKCKKKG